MAKFLTDLKVTSIKDGLWELNAPLHYKSDLLDRVIDIQVGFRTDFASVPRVPLAYWLVGGTANEAAVVHDYLYQFQPCTRKQADLVLLEAMEVTRIPAWRRRLIYGGVRVGGWWAWMKGLKRCGRLNKGISYRKG